MAARPFRPERSWKAFTRRMRELRLIAYGALSTRHPIMAHIIPIRRCNLACAYCNEYDDFSKPVAVDVIKHRIDLLADLGTSIVTMSGGEPILHPDLDDILAHVRKRKMIAAPGGASTTTPAGVNNADSVFATHPCAEHASEIIAPSNQGVPTIAAAGAPETGRARPFTSTITPICGPSICPHAQALITLDNRMNKRTFMDAPN